MAYFDNNWHFHSSCTPFSGILLILNFNVAMSYRQLKWHETVLHNGKKSTVCLHTHVRKLFMLRK